MSPHGILLSAEYISDTEEPATSSWYLVLQQLMDMNSSHRGIQVTFVSTLEVRLLK